MIGSIFNIFYRALRGRSRILGYKVYFAGKLGRKGSVKKSTIYLIRGRISFSSKSLRFSSKNFLVFTETGVVGCYFSIFYKKMLACFLIYLTVYVYTIIIFLGLILNYIKLFNSNDTPLTTIAGLIKKYAGFNGIYLFLLSLSGLPPSSFFFIKLNIIT